MNIKSFFVIFAIVLLIIPAFAATTEIDKFSVYIYDKDPDDLYNCEFEEISNVFDLCYGGCRDADEIIGYTLDGDGNQVESVVGYQAKIPPGCNILTFGHSKCVDGSGDGKCSAWWHDWADLKDAEYEDRAYFLDTGLNVQNGGGFGFNEWCSSNSLATGTSKFYEITESSSASRVNSLPLPSSAKDPFNQEYMVNYWIRQGQIKPNPIDAPPQNDVINYHILSDRENEYIELRFDYNQDGIPIVVHSTQYVPGEGTSTTQTQNLDIIELVDPENSGNIYKFSKFTVHDNLYRPNLPTYGDYLTFFIADFNYPKWAHNYLTNPDQPDLYQVNKFSNFKVYEDPDASFPKLFGLDRISSKWEGQALVDSSVLENAIKYSDWTIGPVFSSTRNAWTPVNVDYSSQSYNVGYEEYTFSCIGTSDEHTCQPHGRRINCQDSWNGCNDRDIFETIYALGDQKTSETHWTLKLGHIGGDNFCYGTGNTAANEIITLLPGECSNREGRTLDEACYSDETSSYVYKDGRYSHGWGLSMPLEELMSYYPTPQGGNVGDFLEANTFCHEYACYVCSSSTPDIPFYKVLDETHSPTFGAYCPPVQDSNFYSHNFDVTLKPGAYVKNSGFLQYGGVYVRRPYVNIDMEGDDRLQVKLTGDFCYSSTQYNRTNDGNVDLQTYRGGGDFYCGPNWESTFSNNVPLTYFSYGGPSYNYTLGVDMPSHTMQGTLQMKKPTGLLQGSVPAEYFASLYTNAYDGTVFSEFDCFDGTSNDPDDLIDEQDILDCVETGAKCRDGIDNNNNVDAVVFLDYLKNGVPSSLFPALPTLPSGRVCDGVSSTAGSASYNDVLQCLKSYSLLTDTDPFTGADGRDWQCHEFSCTDGSDTREASLPGFFNDGDNRIDRADSDCRIETDFSCMFDYNTNDQFEGSTLKPTAEKRRLIARVTIENENGVTATKDVDLRTEVVINPITLGCRSNTASTHENSDVHLDGVSEEIIISKITEGNEIVDFNPMEFGDLQRPDGYEPYNNEVIEGTTVVLEVSSPDTAFDLGFEIYINELSDFAAGARRVCDPNDDTFTDCANYEFSCRDGIEDITDGGLTKVKCTVEGLELGKAYAWEVITFDKNDVITKSYVSESKVFRTTLPPGSVCYDSKGKLIPCSRSTTKRYKDVNLVSLPLGFKYAIATDFNFYRTGTPLAVGCGIDGVVQYYPEDDTTGLFTYNIDPPVGYHSLGECDEQFCEDEELNGDGLAATHCIGYNNDGNNQQDSIIVFENRTYVDMKYTFDFNVVYDTLVSLYSNKDRVPMTLGRAI